VNLNTEYVEVIRVRSSQVLERAREKAENVLNAGFTMQSKKKKKVNFGWE
jgi:hypothetical protein